MANTATAPFVEISFTDLVLTPEEILKNNLTPVDLFEVQVMGDIKGPFYKEALKNNLEALDPDEKCLVKSLADNDWAPVFSHPYFQRRKPSLVAGVSSVKENTPLFLLDNHGQKSGPFMATDIESKLRKNEILFIDVISIDGGKNWSKIHQVERFNRRDLHPQIDLPDLPKGEIFINSYSDAAETLKEHEEEVKTEDAIVGLAFINNVNSNKAHDKALADIMAPVEARKSHWKWLAAVAFGVAIIGIIFSSNSRTKTTKIDEIHVPARANHVPAKKIKVDPKASIQKPSPPKVIQKKVIKRIPATSGIKRAFKDSDAYKFRTTINENAIEADFTEGEMLLPEVELTEEELLELEEKLSKRFSIMPVAPEDGPDSEEGLFNEEASF